MPTEQKTSIGVTRDGFTFQGPIQTDDYMGTIITGSVVIAILFVIALIRWGPKLLGVVKNGNGNGKKTETKPENNGQVEKFATDTVQDLRLNAMEANYRDMKEDISRIETKQDKQIEKQAETGGKVDLILSILMGPKNQ